MYCIVESPKIINIPINDVGNIKYIKSSRDNKFICAITSNDIMIWFTTSSMLIAFHQRADNSISIHGENHIVEWNNDSSKIAVMTTKGYLIYYKITFENDFVINDLSYSQTAWNDSLFSNKFQYQNPILSCKISHEFSIHIQHAHKYIFCLNDEIFIPLLNGKVIKVPWDDQTRHDHFFLLLHRLYFKIETEGELFKLKDNIHLTEFEMGIDEGCIYLAGVLSDAGGIYLFSDSSNVLKGLIAKTVVQDKALLHKCVAVNIQYRLLAFGCKNGIAVAYNQPDDYTSLQISNYYLSNSKENENSTVVDLKWSPDYRCLCVLYDNGTFCLFSVFGTLLYDSKDLLYSTCSNVNYNFVRNFEFGIEGFSLWTYLQSHESQNLPGNLFKLKLLKSSSINNSCMLNVEHLSLNGEREIYVCLNLNKINSNSIRQIETSNKNLPPKYQYPCLKLGGNSIWQIINVPLTYISTNFPIKMSSIDPEGKYLAVAGVRGFTHYSFMTRKWKIFGNADQEKDIRITGGLLWWKEFICMSCISSADQKDEIRFYSRNSNLDNNYSKISKVSCTILQMNIFRNLLILFGTDCRVQVMGLEGGKDTTSKIILNKLIEIPIENYIFGNPFLVVSISLCPLYIGNYNDELKNNIESNNSSLKSILVNVAGNLLMFQPDLEGLLSIPQDLNKTKPFTSMPPILLSSYVENYWVVTNSYKNHLLNHLMNLSLWIFCGYHGLKLWLPLSGEENEIQQSNRIILNFNLNFYPLGLLINESLLIGAQSESTCINQNSYCQIQKTTQLFMHLILEGLIRKNLDLDAKKLAIGYRYLSYFLHILELLIHKILEEEANLTDTSKQILPQVINFISQFPDYLKIISRCTRKSEVAIWPYLFSVVGHPRDLYEKCLSLNDLETATSYLVVIQNTENSKLCEKFANMLLKSALQNSQWDLVSEITRFLSSIDPADYENEVFNYSDDTQLSSLNTTNVDSPKNFKLIKNSNSNKTSSSSLILSPKKLTNNDSYEKLEDLQKQKQTPKQMTKKVSFVNRSTDAELYKKTIETIIYDYANDLFKSYRIKQLFEMFCNLNFLNISSWLKQFQSKAVIENYVQAVSNIHFDFNWPYPILINQNNKTKSFIVDTNDLDTNSTDLNKNKSDFIFEKISENENDTGKSETEEESFNFDVVAQELANTGSNQSKKQLLFMIDTFYNEKCYEWVFILGIVLKRFSILNEVVRLLKNSDLSSEVSNNLKKGIDDLNEWCLNECCGYRPIIQKLMSL